MGWLIGYGISVFIVMGVVFTMALMEFREKRLLAHKLGVDADIEMTIYPLRLVLACAFWPFTVTALIIASVWSD